jgi:hypothetical protein
MSLEEDLKVVKEMESRVLRQHRHEPFELQVRNENEALLLKSLLNREKVRLFQEMEDELERHIIECPGCWRSNTAPVHRTMYELYETGTGIKENVFTGEIEFVCDTCTKRVKGKSVVALLDRIDEDISEVRPYVLKERENAASTRFVEDLSEEDCRRSEEQADQYSKLFPRGVDRLAEWYSQFEPMARGRL